MAASQGVLSPTERQAIAVQRHSDGANLASSVGVAAKVIPVGALASFARQRHATAAWSGTLKSAVASGKAVAAPLVPV